MFARLENIVFETGYDITASVNNVENDCLYLFLGTVDKMSNL